MSSSEARASREATAATSELPLARALVALPPEIFETLQRSVAALFRASRLPAFQARADAGAGETALHRAGNAAVMMGYDFHLTPAGPRLSSPTSDGQVKSVAKNGVIQPLISTPLTGSTG